MSELVLSDCYVAKDGEVVSLPSADEMIKGMESLVVDTNLKNRIVYVPKIQAIDPVDIVDDWLGRIPETRQAFERLRENVQKGKISLTLTV